MRHVRPLLPILLLTLQSCSQGPAPPAKGTPPFYWQAAQESFAAGDPVRTISHLDQLTKTDNEFSARAKPWRMVALWGVLKGHLDIAEKFDYGAKQNKTNPMPFRKQVNDSRSAAGNLAMQLAEAWKGYQGSVGSEILLDFSLPPGSAGPVVALNRASTGILLPPGEIETAKQQAMQRAVLLAAAQSVGAGDDLPKARGLLQAPPAKVTPEVFLGAMSRALYDSAKVFDPNGVDRPDVMQMLCSESSAALDKTPDSKEKKEMQTKLQDCLKKGKAMKKRT
jgi:hypothetical protein